MVPTFNYSDYTMHIQFKVCYQRLLIVCILCVCKGKVKITSTVSNCFICYRFIFLLTVTAGKTVIERHSRDFTSVVPDQYSVRTLKKIVENALEDKEVFYIDPVSTNR